MRVQWSALKSFVDSRSLSIQWSDALGFYQLCAFDGPLSMECNLRIDDPADDDQSDFETHYKANGNKTPLQQKPFADSLGFRARLKGFTGTATAGQSNNIDYKLTEERYINGTQIILSNQNFGDTIKFQVVDKDNILGYGAGVVLDEFASTWNVTSDKQDQGVYVLSYPAKIIANLYIRLVYNSTGGSDVSVAVNLFLHKKS